MEEQANNIVELGNVLNTVIKDKYKVDPLDLVYTSMYESETNKEHKLSKEEIKLLIESYIKDLLLNPKYLK